MRVLLLVNSTASSVILLGDSKSLPQHFDPDMLAAFRSGVADFRDIFETIRD